MNITDYPSSNFDARSSGVDMLVLHYTDTKTAQEALDILVDPTPGHRVSAHYLVDEAGKIFRLVAEDKRAWHAGVSAWRGHRDVNARSVGIEIANPGHRNGYRPFPEAQMQAVLELSQGIIGRHNIPPRNVVAHSDIAPGRKMDPGELFDWAWLAAQGIGLWSEPNVKGQMANVNDLAVYGYDIQDISAAIMAFQRHFRPQSLTGTWDEECGQLLAALLKIA